MAFDITTAKPINKQKFDLSTARVIDDKEEKKSNALLGAGQAVGQGLTFGQAPHVAGAGEALGGAIYNLVNKRNPLNELYKDYKAGNERFKKEYQTFQEEHPFLSLGGEITGGVATGGAGAKILSLLPKTKNILAMSKVLNNPLTKASATGGAYGLGYGASNTQDKTIDAKSGILGATIGSVSGGALGALGKLGKFALISNNKSKVIDELRPFGINRSTIEHIANDKEVAKEVAKGGIGKKTMEFQRNMTKSLDDTIGTIEKEIKNAYSGFNHQTTKIDLNKGNAINNIEKEINLLNQNIGTDVESNKVLKQANNILKDIKANSNNGEITLGKIKELKDRIYRLQNKTYDILPTGQEQRKVSQETINLLDDMYNSLSGAEKSHSPQLAKANELFSDMQKVRAELSRMQRKGSLVRGALIDTRNDINVENFYNHIKNIENIVNKYPQIKDKTNKLFTDIRKFAVSYNIRPEQFNIQQSLNPGNILRTILAGGTREQQMQMLANAVKKGKLDLPMLNKEFNRARMYFNPLNYYLALSKVPQAHNISEIASQATKINKLNKNDLFNRHILPKTTIKTIMSNKEQ